MIQISYGSGSAKVRKLNYGSGTAKAKSYGSYGYGSATPISCAPYTSQHFKVYFSIGTTKGQLFKLNLKFSQLMRNLSFPSLAVMNRAINPKNLSVRGAELVGVGGGGN